MSRKRLKTIGVLGGMGPEAGAAFLEKIVRETEAERDQDHPPVILYSLPQIPDRTEAILHGGRDPVPALRHGLAVLEHAGADFAVMSCVSAHYFLPRLVPRSPLPLISLIDETVAAIKIMKPVPRCIGLLATDGTVRSGVIARPCEAAGIIVLTPSSRDQVRLMTAIYGKKSIKAGFTRGSAQEAVLDVARGLVRRGAEAVVAGCTEVPLVLAPADLPVPLVDPMIAGARASVRRSGARLIPARSP